MPRWVSVRPYPEMPPEVVCLPETLEEYAELWKAIDAQRSAGHFETWKALMRIWTLADQYFLLRYVWTAGRNARNEYRGGALLFEHEAHIRFARAIQFGPMDDTVVIGARGFGKSTQLDVDDTRQKLLDPNHASVLFSLTKSLAQKHLEVLRQEFDTNDLLKEIWDDRFWRDEDERRAAGKIPWGTGTLRLKRTSSRPEESFEAHSFEYQLPTGMHYDLRRYDDIEADRSVNSDITQETIEERWVSSQNLSSTKRQRRVTGTYYAPSAMMVRLETEYGLQKLVFAGEDVEDKVPAEEAGPLGGRPVNGFTREELWRRLKDAGGAEIDGETGEWKRTGNQKANLDYARQTACNPIAGEAEVLDKNWLLHYDGEGSGYARDGNVVICADCSPGLGDPTFIWVWLLTRDKEYWWVDGERRRVAPAARKELIHAVTQRWINYGANVVQLRLENYGQATYVQDQREHWATMPKFPAPPVIKCSDPRRHGSGDAYEGKIYRIYNRWQGPLSSGKVRFPVRMVRIDEIGRPVDLVHHVKEFEIGMFPRPKTDDGLDAGGVIWEDPKLVGPIPWPETKRWNQERGESRERSYATAGLL